MSAPNKQYDPVEVTALSPDEIAAAVAKALADIAAARQRWHTATEADRQRALMADTELRRRHPDLELPPLHPEEDMDRSERQPAGLAAEKAAADSGPTLDGAETTRLDLQAALDAARRAELIITERQRQTDRDPERASDDLMRWREAEARQEAAARRSAVRQEPAPSRDTLALERDELELEAGH